MATVYGWNPFGVALDITATSGGVTRISATQYTVKINASWEVYYSGTNTTYGMEASSGGAKAVLSAYSNGGNTNGSGSFTGTYSISGNGSATKTIVVTFKNYGGNGTPSATNTVSFDVTVPAWTSYTVSYNANGGSGAPSSQTKWKDQSLTLSSTKPTRTGYTFSKWNTKSDGSGTSYSSGGSYTANSGATLYAIWNENALTVNYYSNYATESFSGALNPVGANKNVIVRTSDFYYDNDYTENGHWDYSFKDSSTYLGRTGYTATGYWGTSPNGGTLVKQSAPYASGQAMAEAVGKSLKNGNASVDLYAQWNINTYTVAYNANGGYGNMNSQSVKWNESFVVSDNLFLREGYKFIGWNLYRNDDNKWYVPSHGWMTEDEILANGYSKALYVSQRELTLGESWVKGNDDARLFTYYAVWEISGVVYIDNGVSLEPYLTYIDNGTGWDLYLAYVGNGVDWDIIS